uniref:Methyltransferase type 11 n=1 Tax=Cyanothece sp. (strain PCC 7425 / ATCC 29141) TaxID=395961 RepID=B8HTZ2_CYAP4
MADFITIPGFAALQSLTKGDPRIKIAVLDGPADLDRACFRGARISRVKPYWQEALEPIDPFFVQQELKIRTLNNQKKALKKAKKVQENQPDLEATIRTHQNIAAQSAGAIVQPSSLIKPELRIFNTRLEPIDPSPLQQYQLLKAGQQLTVPRPTPTVIFPPPPVRDLAAEIEALEAEINSLEATIPQPIRERLNGVFHATGIFGTMFGQPGSPVEGIAPYCTAINIPLFETATSSESISPLNLAHAFNLALELKVNIIHCAACHPTQSGFAHEMIQQAVKRCQENNILIVAPSGNNNGEWFCVPAVLPNVMAVGMMKDNGQPASYSNWGGQYQQQGILAPGENIVAALPGTDEPARQEGTSLAAPVITGISALLMSVQLQRGMEPNAEMVRTALLKSAIPCDPTEVEEPERCLAGKLNIPGAFKAITGEALIVVTPDEALTAIQSTGQTDAEYLQELKHYYNSMNPVIVQDVGTTYQAALVTTDAADPFRATNLFVAERAGIKPGDYLLDAGCGAGGPAIDIAQNFEGVRIEGITISESQAQTAHQLIQQANLSDRIHVHVGDFHHLPFENNTFDVVYFLETMGHTIDLPGLCAEVYRVLRPGKTLYLKEIFIKEPPLTEQEEQDLAVFQKIYAYRTPRLSEFEAAIRATGFQDVKATDLTGIVSIEEFGKKMFDANNEFTEFGKFHYYEFRSLPVFCGEIKAYKPLTVASSASASSAHSAPDRLNRSPAFITPSAVSNKVYVLGTIGYDFGTTARRDTFKQQMPAMNRNDVPVPANPYDPHQMVAYLEQNPAEGKSLIWTLNQELTPIYALDPRGAFAPDIYTAFQILLAGQILSESSEDYIERVSIPGFLTDRIVELFSGQVVPVLSLPNLRGLYGWKVNTLVEAAVATISSPDPVRVRRSLYNFLQRVYYDLRNLGQLDRERALNFAVTNAFQAATTFAEAVSMGMELDSIAVEKSSFCRIDSNCWDIKLKFFDPDSSRRAKKIFCFTIDVKDIVPVTLGDVKTWSVPR